VIAEGVSQVPWKLHTDGRSEAGDHPTYDLIYRRPNPWQTSFEFRETIMFHVVLTGNAFVRKLRVGSVRRLASLEPLDPGRVTVRVEADGRMRYWYQGDSGERVEIPADDIWHIRGPSWNSYVGMDAVKLAREAIGLALATEATQADFHRNGTRVSGLYSVENNMSVEKFNQISAWMDRHAQGGDRAGKPFILDNKATFSQLQMTGVDAQHLETRKHQVEEICRAMRVMPIMVGQSDKAATYASAEQMFLAHVVHTLMPWYERLEQSADVNLLSDEDRARGFYTKFNANALMRGAAKDRGEYYSKALGAGGTPAWLTQDEVRDLEEYDPMGGTAAALSQGAMSKPSDANAGA
jgi:HK97 family phage portal protein